MIYDHDKTSENSISYWFKIIDLDGEGQLTNYSLKHFYIGHEFDLTFSDWVCQMADVFQTSNFTSI
jgi:serine/threonine-protein phosphatase 2A regulatory subunit B''